MPTLSEFIQSLRNRADILETMLGNKSEKPVFHREHKKHEGTYNTPFQHKHHKSFAASSKLVLSCPCCNQRHKIIDCSEFKNFTPENRLNRAIQLNLCLNCLRKGHTADDCRLSTCRICKEKHNTLICTNRDKNRTDSVSLSLSAQSTGQVLRYSHGSRSKS